LETPHAIWLIVGSVLPALAVSLIAGYVVRAAARRLGLVALPGGHSTHKQPTPLGGGLAIWLGVVLPLAVGQLLLWSLSRDNLDSLLGIGSLRQFVQPHLPGLLQQGGKLWTLLAGGTVLALLGLWDDRKRLDWRFRLLVQTVVAAAIVTAGWQLSLFIDAPWLTGALSVIWIVGLINAFNMLDNMDGLSAGVAAIAAGILAAVILTAPDPVTHGPQLFVGGLLLVLVGSLLGFLWHNVAPARLFMGDAGSYFVGYMMATATISATFAGPGLPDHAILAPLCVLAVPLYDMCTVIIVRLRAGRSPFTGDRSHVSHRLTDFGLSRPLAVGVIWLATLVCGMGAFMLHRVDRLGAAIVLGVVVLVLAGIAVVDLKWNRKNHGP
jgi:UDP-GlcNAc:undecaprenyl-phosphate GlcNAc-1-phosphate transferase